MIVLAVTWIARGGHEAEVAGLFRHLTEQTLVEPGCRMFLVHRHMSEPRRFFIYEQYDDEAALDAHRSTPYFQQIVKSDLPQLADRIEGNLYEPL